MSSKKVPEESRWVSIDKTGALIIGVTQKEHTVCGWLIKSVGDKIISQIDEEKIGQFGYINLMHEPLFTKAYGDYLDANNAPKIIAVLPRIYDLLMNYVRNRRRVWIKTSFNSLDSRYWWHRAYLIQPN